jgi:nitrilase
MMTKVAAIQMVSSTSVTDNIARARRLVAEAAATGACLVVLPEYWPIMGMADSDKVSHGEPLGDGPIQQFMASAAREHGVWLVGGTLPLASHDADKILNSTLVFDPQGQRVARYDKIHLFGFSKGDESYDEAQTIVPGEAITHFEAPFGKVGLSVCYDLRFPELYRALGDCALLIVTAAFTHTTGIAHWEVLLRARAIENQCFLLAAAQGGQHENGRRTFGRSMLIDPWGKIIAMREEGEGVVSGDIDLLHLAEIRSNLPALRHRKL